MRQVWLAGAAVAAIVAAQVVRPRIADRREAWPSQATAPYAPSPGAAPYVSLGYREVAADLMWIRTLAYLGGTTDTATGVQALVEATIALDPWFERAYDGALAIESATHGVDNAAHLAAVSVLERAMARFPDSWRYPYQIGQIYVVDLVTTDPAERRAWNERGVAMLERAVRHKATPAYASALAAHMHETLGRREAAIQVLRQKMALTSDPGAQQLLIDELAKLEEQDPAALAAAMLDEQAEFRAAWRAARPVLPETMYLLLGAAPDPHAAPETLAVDRDLIGAAIEEPLEPLDPDGP